MARLPSREALTLGGVKSRNAGKPVVPNAPDCEDCLEIIRSSRVALPYARRSTP